MRKAVITKFVSYYKLWHLLQRLPAVNYYHKALHLGCCSSPRSATANSSDTVKSFDRLIKIKVCESNEEAIEWSLSSKPLIRLLDRRPLPELYNAVYYTLFDGSREDEFGYNITTSSNKATQIWSIACDWGYLIV